MGRSKSREREKFHRTVVDINMSVYLIHFCPGAYLCTSYSLGLDYYSLQSSDGCYLLVIQISVSVSFPQKTFA